jgi:hypothetical protein
MYYKSTWIIFVSLFSLFGSICKSYANCTAVQSLSKSLIKYDFKVKLDTKDKSVKGRETIKWVNTGNTPVSELRFYMYLNAFKNMKSTFLKGSNGVIFGTTISNIKKDEWGYVEINNPKIQNNNITSSYIQPNDGNLDDQSVLKMQLTKAINPGETAEITMDIVCKLPKFIVRAGYSRDDFYAFLHWFPQLGVYEVDKKGQWNWNCHQFFRQTEFFADFAEYNLELDLPKNIKIGHTGCLVKEYINNDRKVLNIHAKDVIDFAWVAYPYFEEYRDKWEDVDIKILYPAEHSKRLNGYIQGIKNSLNFFKEKIAKYPYPSITLIDPPMHGLGSGFMEYPMLITCASFHYVPDGIRTIESLAVHEFSHQFFMAILASNEKEEAWLDEGLVTFFEDEIMDHYYGKKQSIFDLWGFKSGNHEQSRLEYTAVAREDTGPLALPGWKLNQAYYKPLVYAKTSLIFQTLKNIFGDKLFYSALKKYYDKFSHPKEKDLISTLREVLGNNIIHDSPLDTFMFQGLHTDNFIDFSISHDQKNNAFTLSNLGEFKISMPYKIFYKNGTSKTFLASKESLPVTIKDSENIESIAIDIDHKICLDINFNNNSFTKFREVKPSLNYAIKTNILWQTILHSLTYLL